MESECYCTSLRAAARRLSAIYDRALDQVEVNVAQFALLRRLELGDPVSVSALADRLDLERSTVTRNVGVLERRGLAQTRPVHGDARATGVLLTGAGSRCIQTGLPLWRQAQHDVEQRLGAGPAQDLRSALQAL